ncbi:hypothetical protein OE88DRAFT_646214 [Heliocybe sulcata]|uniref:CCHC-type domain-containing protein n=1 Tax=Heliocybe sulcata TaxID=5364 RepID=A0A5C3NE62_9AGAM|nr:hypothetical protein OE88DRAFT_646214 [Heliocybe sulcata]
MKDWNSVYGAVALIQESGPTAQGTFSSQPSPLLVSSSHIRGRGKEGRKGRIEGFGLEGSEGIWRYASSCGDCSRGQAVTQVQVISMSYQFSRKGCFKCGNIGHIAENCTSEQRLCYNCRQPGHESSACPQPRTASMKQCYSCGGVGHIQAECPSLRVQGGNQKCYVGSRTNLSIKISTVSLLYL